MTREEITEWADSIEINEQADCYHDPFKAAERVAFLREQVTRMDTQADYGTKTIEEAHWTRRAHIAETRLWLLIEALKECKVRIHFVGIPSEPKLPDGGPSWEKTINMIENALGWATAESYKPDPVLEKHHGTIVQTDVGMDSIRRERCLCLRCGKHECFVAKQLFEFCKKFDIALAVTRCPEWIVKV